MTMREITLIGGPHDGRTVTVDDRFAIINTVEVVRCPRPIPRPPRLWERMLNRTPDTVPWEPFAYFQHQYDAHTGQYINPVEDQ